MSLDIQKLRCQRNECTLAAIDLAVGIGHFPKQPNHPLAPIAIEVPVQHSCKSMEIDSVLLLARCRFDYGARIGIGKVENSQKNVPQLPVLG